VTSSVTWPFGSPYAIFYWWSFGTKPLSLTVSEIFNVECSTMVDMTLIRPLNEGQGHSFWYQSISHIWLPIGSQINSKFCSRTHRLATIHSVQTPTDGRITVPIAARPLVRSFKSDCYQRPFDAISQDSLSVFRRTGIPACPGIRSITSFASRWSLKFLVRPPEKVCTVMFLACYESSVSARQVRAQHETSNF